MEERQFQIVAEATDGSQLFPRKAQTIVLVKYPPTLRHLRESRLALDVPKIEFIPLPKTIFLALGKPVKSIILRFVIQQYDVTEYSTLFSILAYHYEQSILQLLSGGRFCLN